MYDIIYYLQYAIFIYILDKICLLDLNIFDGKDMTSNTMPINIRLSKIEHQKYQNQAASCGLPISTYLKQKLEYNDKLLKQNNRLIEEITSLKRLVSQISEIKYATGDKGDNINIMIEMLLLLLQPKHIQLAQQELKRLGIDHWRSSRFGS